jgi:hypothetical protein
MRGSCQKTEAVARLETLYFQRQLPELQKKSSVHFSRLSGRSIEIVPRGGPPFLGEF